MWSADVRLLFGVTLCHNVRTMQKKRSFKLLCAVFIREGEFGFGWAIWTALAHFEAAAVVTVIHTAKCQKLFYKA